MRAKLHARNSGQRLRVHTCLENVLPTDASRHDRVRDTESESKTNRFSLACTGSTTSALSLAFAQQLDRNRDSLSRLNTPIRNRQSLLRRRRYLRAGPERVLLTRTEPPHSFTMSASPRIEVEIKQVTLEDLPASVRLRSCFVPFSFCRLRTRLILSVSYDPGSREQ